MIRPRPARWFELLAARDDATIVLEALAATGAVELEARRSAGLPAALADIRPQLAEFAELSSRYRAYWPPATGRPSAFPEPPAATLARSLAQLRAWAEDAEPAIGRLQGIATERSELLLWHRVLVAIGGSPIDFARLASTGPALHARLFVFPADSMPELPPGALSRQVDLDGTLPCARAALTVGSHEDVQALTDQVALLKGRVHDAPAWLDRDVGRSERYIASRLAALAQDEAGLHAALATFHARHRVAPALADTHRLQWVMQNVHALESGDLFCWITGWTSDFAGARLTAALDAVNARALLHFPPPAIAARAPLLLHNPAWIRPFEVFSRALGMPSGNEADPALLLAVMVPLMFGYMFGDVGQGLVIAAAGLALRKRYPIARLFIAGGLAAAVFGLIFGSVFSMHALPALWTQPLDAPLAILLVPLVGGAALLTVGLLLNALQSIWRGETRAWLAADAGFGVAYLGILACSIDRAALVVAAAGAAVFCLGHAWHAGRLSAVFGAAAELVERLLQILINTLSFARVGAFALAHAGLSSAIVALMDASDNGAVRVMVLVAGNALVLGLEVLVVSIQTTRLVLFEFFTRFLTAEGRVFRPLAAPFTTQEQT